MGSVYLDACAIIEAREKPTPEGQAIIDLIVEVSRDETPFVTSDLTLLEVLVKPIQGLVDRLPVQEDPVLESDHDWYQGNLVPDGLLIQTLPITRDILVQAALIRARAKSIKTPDAIHIATAYRHACSYFVTGDSELAKKLDRDITWLASGKSVTFVDLKVAALNALKAELLS